MKTTNAKKTAASKAILSDRRDALKPIIVGAGGKTVKASKPAKATKTAGRTASKKVLAFSASLPESFQKEFKERAFKLARTGTNLWTLNGKATGGITEAMNAILVATVGENNGRTADSFFAAAARGESKPAAKAEPKGTKIKKAA